MYKLTLNKTERDAVDWISNRYSHGNELFDLLWHENVSRYSLTNPDINHEDIDWLEDYDITFNIPEHIAWGINEIIQENNYALECFCDELKVKLISFSENIV